MSIGLILSIVFALVAFPASAGDYSWKPEKPVTIIVPWSAGGSTDSVLRAAHQHDPVGFCPRLHFTDHAIGATGT